MQVWTDESEICVCHHERAQHTAHQCTFCPCSRFKQFIPTVTFVAKGTHGYDIDSHGLALAAKYAQQAKCLRGKRGAIIVNPLAGKGLEQAVDILGVGWNSLPEDKPPTTCRKDSLPLIFKSEKACCIHAEQRAIIAAIRHKRSLMWSELYYAHIDEGGKIIPSGHPYCTICSKLALDVGVETWILLQSPEVFRPYGIELDGPTICRYKAHDYNEFSFAHRPKG